MPRMAFRRPVRDAKLPGFTLLEVTVAAVIMAILLAAMLPTTVRQFRIAQAGAIASELEALRDAIETFEDDVNAWPSDLTLLTTAPVNGDEDSCGDNLSNAERNRWEGPYVNQVIESAVVAGDALIQTPIVRVPTDDDDDDEGQLRLSVTQVDSVIAVILESQYDATASFATGTIRWIATAPGTGTLTFAIAIRDC